MKRFAALFQKKPSPEPLPGDSGYDYSDPRDEPLPGDSAEGFEYPDDKVAPTSLAKVGDDITYRASDRPAAGFDNQNYGASAPTNYQAMPGQPPTDSPYAARAETPLHGGDAPDSPHESRVVGVVKPENDEVYGRFVFDDTAAALPETASAPSADASPPLSDDVSPAPTRAHGYGAPKPLEFPSSTPARPIADSASTPRPPASARSLGTAAAASAASAREAAEQTAEQTAEAGKTSVTPTAR